VPEITYREGVRDALLQAMRENEDVFLMGEDIAEMGGSMGVTQGLLGEDDFESFDAQAHEIVDAALVFAQNGTDPQPEDALKNVYA
jgi:acetoin:2,6-dichlorophenolindophenol oxidoreductase subunit beta